MKEKIGEFNCYRNDKGEVEMVYKPAPGAPKLTDDQKEVNKIICDGFTMLVNSYNGNLDKALDAIIRQLEEEEQKLGDQVAQLKAELPKSEPLKKVEAEASEDE